MNKKNSILFISATSISRIGNMIFSIFISYFVSVNTSSTLLLGLITGISLLPNSVLSLLSGYLSDKKRKLTLLYIYDIISASICFTGFFISNGDILSEKNIIVIVGINMILNSIATLYSPTSRAIIPTIISRKDIKNYNSLYMASSSLIKALIPLIFTMSLIYKLNINYILLINGITFLVSFVLTKNIVAKDDIEISKSTVFIDKKNIISYLKKEKKLLLVIFLSMFINFLIASYDVILPYYSKIFSLTNSYYGYLLAIQYLGSIISSFLLLKINENKISLNKLTFMPIILSVGFFLIGVGNNFYLALISNLLIGVFTGLFNIVLFTIIQKNISKNYIGMTMGVVNFVSLICAPAGSFIIGISGEYIDISNIFKLLAGLCILLVIVFSFFILISIRKYRR